jgi:protein arginine N-methyltransferase 5
VKKGRDLDDWYGTQMSRLPLILNVQQSGIPPSSSDSSSTAITQLAEEASLQDYDAICIPLTNDLWRERWERLCLRPVEDELEDDSLYQQRSDTREWVAREKQRRDTENEAEMWRSHGGFKRTELNITRLGN